MEPHPGPALGWVLKARVNGLKPVSRVIATNGQVSAPQNRQVIKQSSGQRAGPSICLHLVQSFKSTMAVPTGLAFCRWLQECPTDRWPSDCQLGVDAAHGPGESAFVEVHDQSHHTSRGQKRAEVPRTSAATAPSSGSREDKEKSV